MRPAEPAYDAAELWDIATPARPGRLPGVSMAGFHGRTADFLDLGVIPYPAVTVAFDLGDRSFAVDDVSGSVAVGLAADGLRGRGQSIECLQIRLSPLFAHTVLGPAATTPGAPVISLDDLWGDGVARVQERLRAAGSWEERFALAEDVLIRRHLDGRAADPEVAFVWRQMLARRGGVRVERLADETGWSRKRLWSRFRDQIGLPPKRAALLVRFDHAAHRLAAGAGAARVAAEIGYADQSHLHRDIATFTGTTPLAVAAAPWLAVDEVAWDAPAYLSAGGRP